MTARTYSSVDSFRHGAHRIVLDQGGCAVEIPGNSNLDGFLCMDGETGAFSQVKILHSDDERRQKGMIELWNAFLKSPDSPVLPKMLAVTKFDDCHSYLSSLPCGEPVTDFVERNGKLPVEVSAKLIKEFVVNLRKHPFQFYKKIAISPQSYWAARTSSQPCIVISDFCPVNHSNPEIHNVETITFLLKFLSDGNGNSTFLELLRTLGEGPKTMEFLEECLVRFVNLNPSSNHWMGFNEPKSIVENVSFPVTKESNSSGESALMKAARDGFWPVLIAATICVSALIGWCIFSTKGDVPHFASATPVIEVIEPQPAPKIIIKKTTPPPAPVVKVSKPAPKPVLVSAPVVTEKSASVSNQAQHVTPAGPIIVSERTELPEHLRTILAETGDLFPDASKKELSKWLIYGDPDPNRGRKDDYTFTEADRKALEVLKLKKAAYEARAKNSTIQAVKHEVALLKLLPESIDSRVRLHDYLTELKNEAATIEITDENIETLVNASTENSVARDILNDLYIQRRNS